MLHEAAESTECLKARLFVDLDAQNNLKQLSNLVTVLFLAKIS